MIKRLQKRIFWLMLASLSLVIFVLVFLCAFLSYNNTIHTATLMMDRVMGVEPKKNWGERKELERNKPEIEGLYFILVENGAIVQNENNGNSKEIEEYAIKAVKKNAQKGIVGKYIYQTKKIRENIVSVTLMENEKAILHIKIIVVLFALLFFFLLILIYGIAKKLSKMLVKPVEETFEKQKQFISDASHELKTPLAVMEANIEVLENKVGSNKWMTYIQNEIESMNQLINELLLLAKIEKIDNIEEYQEFDLSQEIEIMVSMFESMAYEKQITLKNEIQQNIIINGKKEDLEHIVSTLVDNAIKHTSKGKEIQVRLKKEKNEIVLQVRNEGEAIPEEEREKIFERFYRIDQARNRKEKRYGLGLAIAKSTVQKYGGKIEVQCENQVTTFQVTIPNEKVK